MKIRLLLMAFIAVIIVGCVYTNQSFSLSLMDSFYKEEGVTKIIEFNPNRSQLSRLKQILQKEKLVPWKYSEIVHSCEGPVKCTENGHTEYIFISFVPKESVIEKTMFFLMTANVTNFAYTISTNTLKNNIHVKKKAELCLSVETKEIVWFKIKNGNQWIEIDLGKKTEI